MEKDIARIDWSRPAADVHNFIRGSDRQPGAWTTLNGAPIKLYGSSAANAPADPDGAAGSVAAVSDSGVVVRCGDGAAIQVDTAQADGGKRVAAHEWAAEAGVESGTQFE